MQNRALNAYPSTKLEPDLPADNLKSLLLHVTSHADYYTMDPNLSANGLLVDVEISRSLANIP